MKSVSIFNDYSSRCWAPLNSYELRWTSLTIISEPHDYGWWFELSPKPVCMSRSGQMFDTTVLPPQSRDSQLSVLFWSVLTCYWDFRGLVRVEMYLCITCSKRHVTGIIGKLGVRRTFRYSVYPKIIPVTRHMSLAVVVEKRLPPL